MERPASDGNKNKNMARDCTGEIELIKSKNIRVHYCKSRGAVLYTEVLSHPTSFRLKR